MNFQGQSYTEQTLYGYRLTGVLQENVLGTLYKALDSTSGKPVSIQVFSPLIGKDPVLSEQLSEHFEKLTRLKHPNLLQVLDYENGDDGCILVQEYVEGPWFNTYLAKRGKLEWQRALRYIHQLLSGMAYAHQSGMLHEGLSPFNIILTQGNVIKITNFGLEKLVREHSYLSSDPLRDQYHFLYLAPEQHESFGATTVASDLYSIGLLAYEMLAGRNPHGRVNDTYFTTTRLSNLHIPPLQEVRPAVPEHISKAIMNALESHQVHRFKHAEEMLEALESVEEVIAPQPKVVYHAESVQESRVRLKKVFLYGVAGVVLMIALFMLYMYLKPKNPFLELESGAATSLKHSEVQVDITEAEARQERRQQREAVREASPSVADARPSADERRAVPRNIRTLQLESRPSGAQVLLNGRKVGKTPLSVEPEKAGAATVVLTLDGYEPLSRDITIYEDRPTEASFNLEPQTGLLFLSVEPWGTVYLDGRLLAERIQGSETLKISRRRHTLSVVHPTYGRWERRIDPLSDEAMDFTIDFREQTSIAVTSFDLDKQFVQGEIYIDGQPTGLFTPSRVELPVGLHTIEVRVEGYEPAEKNIAINIDGNREAPLEFSLRKKTNEG